MANKKIKVAENQEFIPQEFVDATNIKLTTAEANLLGTLCFYHLNYSIYVAEHDGWFFKDQKTLFEESYLSPADGKRVMLKLIFKRLVERISGTNHRCTMYRLCKGIRASMPQNPEADIDESELEDFANEPLDKNRLVTVTDTVIDLDSDKIQKQDLNVNNLNIGPDEMELGDYLKKVEELKENGIKVWGS